MNAKHTAGPWLYSQEGRAAFGIVKPDGTSIVHLSALHNSTAERDLEANARLIAAAPELLEALEGVTRILEAFGYTTALGKTQMARMDAARAAIAKAKGEA